MRIILILLVCISVYSCSLDCVSEKKGRIDLLSIAPNYLPYTDGQKVNFTNNTGKQIVLTVSRTEDVNQLCTKLLCKGISDPFGNPPCEYVDAEYITVTLSNEGNTMILVLSAYIDLYEPETELFYDALSTSYSSGADFAEGRIGQEAHFSAPVFDQGKLAFAAPMHYEQDAMLNGQSYGTLLVADIGTNKIYLKSGIGILAFTNSQGTFVAN